LAQKALAGDRCFGLALGLPPETRRYPVILLHSRQSKDRPYLEIKE
jgi:hypothetical protein